MCSKAEKDLVRGEREKTKMAAGQDLGHRSTQEISMLAAMASAEPYVISHIELENSLANIVKRISRDGLDAFAQLLNQFENTGPPPADEEKIQSLPTVPVTEEHVGSGLECPVCKDDYALGEQLPRNHLFYDGCIVHRLEQHDSCPVCRKSLPGHNTATNTPAPGPTGMNCSSSSSSPASSSPSKENATSNS
ncbi:E3 ubiquitin-protein ligase RNF126-like [Pan troglodytes]|uniref:E3 ubiquitin-protein ligase RNF126-like n=1 Tax=Pan troglodytes TaxID=9598 RepID=UPI003014124A